MKKLLLKTINNYKLINNKFINNNVLFLFKYIKYIYTCYIPGNLYYLEAREFLDLF